MNKMGVILRKYHGRFDAYIGGTRMPSTFASSAPTIGGTFGALSALLLPVLVILAIVAVLLSFGGGHGHSDAMFGLAAAGSVEIKKLEDELKSTFEQFKQTHTALEAEQKKQGDATAETSEQLKKLNARLDDVEIKAQRARIQPGLDRIDDEIREGREKRGPERKAFAKWARRGHTRLNPEEVKSLTSLKTYDPEDAEYKALDTDSDVEGGVFVPHQLANRVIQKLILVSPFRSVASVENISSSALEIPAEGTTNFNAGWVGERSSRPQTTPGSLRMERIPVHEMYAEPPVSQTQLDDSVFDIETWLSSRVSTVMAQLEGLAFIKGTGVTQPEGIANNTAIPAGQQLTIANGTFTANTTSQGADKLIDVWSTLPTFYANAGTWVLNRATLGTIRKFKDNNNQYLWAPGGFGDGNRGGFPATIMGQPYVEMPDMDNVGAGKFPIMFGNWQAAYQIVDRLGMRVIRDNLTNKPFVLFYTTKRVGGQVVLGEAIVQLKTT